jgi:hypothetical protein
VFGIVLPYRVSLLLIGKPTCYIDYNRPSLQRKAEMILRSGDEHGFKEDSGETSNVYHGNYDPD